MPVGRLTAFLKNYLRSVWIPSVLLILCGAIPVLATSYASSILGRDEKPSALLAGMITLLLYAALVPVAIASLGLLIAGIYQTLSGFWLKGLVNLIASIVLNLGLLALFLYGFIALP